jgi:hypothetical protein
MGKTSTGRISLTGVLACMALAASAPPAQGAFGVEGPNFEAQTCTNPGCTYKGVEANHAEAFTQAAGHPPYGITAFELNHKKELLNEEPEGALKRLRVDVPPGLAADPEALPKCSVAEFNANKCPESGEASTVVGETELTVWLLAKRTTIKGTVYNLQQPLGLPLEFGIHVEVTPLINEHIFLEGHDSWNTDYHEYFEINNVSKTVPVLESKLIFNGRSGNGNFLTLPSVCSGEETSYLEVESWEGAISRTKTQSPLSVGGCDKVPFKPTVLLTPETSQADTPDGVLTEVKIPQNAGAEEINTADIKDAHVTMPEGLTLNPSAAAGLQACTAAQIGIGQTTPVNCPLPSKLSSVTIETDLPAGSLTGSVYLGSPGGQTITGPPYTIYVDAESVYGVSVRLQGSVNANPLTGRLEATFVKNPELPFSDLILKLNGGPRAPLANPLVCGSVPAEALFTPYTGVPPSYNLPPSPFATSGCPSPLPFALIQSTQVSSSSAAAFTSYTFNLGRTDGQQYLSQVRAVLPAGLVGAIPSVPLCSEPRASEGTCPPGSRIGTATVNVGAGPEPIAFAGPVFLTGPYGGAPYGLSVAVPAKVGIFDLGSGPCDCVVTRASIGVDPYTARVVATSSLPTIVQGVPLRLKSLTVAVDRPKFLFNPTSCQALDTDTTLTSTFGATQSLSTPFQATGCSSLAFKPKFTASTKAKTSRAIGAALKTKIVIPSGMQANIRSVFVELPKQFPARTSTLNLACREAVFAANPLSCPSGAYVGTVIVSTPVLPDRLIGPAILVSHGGAAFPDLDFVLSGDGVTVILVGHTNIVKNITSSNFASLPDVPVSSVEVKLPQGRKSALGAVGNLCKKPLLMPTTITGQNGKTIKQKTRIAVAGCPRKHKHRRHHHRRHRHSGQGRRR